MIRFMEGNMVNKKNIPGQERQNYLLVHPDIHPNISASTFLLMAFVRRMYK